MKPRRLSRTTIYESSWVNLHLDKVEYPDGRIIPQHHILEFPKASVAALVENDRQEVILIQSYRYSTDSIEWEIPAGICENEESIFDTAKREVLEETGYQTKDHTHFYSYNPINGISTAVHHIVHCKTIDHVADFDRNEVKMTRWISIPKIREMIETQIFNDGYSLIALLLLLLRRSKSK